MLLMACSACCYSTQDHQPGGGMPTMNSVLPHKCGSSSVKKMHHGCAHRPCLVGAFFFPMRFSFLKELYLVSNWPQTCQDMTFRTQEGTGVLSGWIKEPEFKPSFPFCRTLRQLPSVWALEISYLSAP